MSRPLQSRNGRVPTDLEPAPWWRFGMVWFILSGPAVVVVAGFVTLALCLLHPDVELHESAAVPAKGTKATSRAATWQAGDAATISGH